MPGSLFNLVDSLSFSSLLLLLLLLRRTALVYREEDTVITLVGCLSFIAVSRSLGNNRFVSRKWPRCCNNARSSFDCCLHWQYVERQGRGDKVSTVHHIQVAMKRYRRQHTIQSFCFCCLYLHLQPCSSPIHPRSPSSHSA